MHVHHLLANRRFALAPQKVVPVAKVKRKLVNHTHANFLCAKQSFAFALPEGHGKSHHLFYDLPLRSECKTNAVAISFTLAVAKAWSKGKKIKVHR